MLGSAIASDWLGAGATFVTILRDSFAGSDTAQWHRSLRVLAQQGWNQAAEVRNQHQPNLPLPDKLICVDYVMACVDSGTMPTVHGLISSSGSGLNDTREPMRDESAALFLQLMLENLLSDRSYYVQKSITEFIRQSQESCQKLEDRYAKHAREINSLHNRANELTVSLNLLTTPALQPQDREIRGDGLFDFRSDAVDFQGREQELEALVGFCTDWNDSHNWRWQAITGPGGAGKSRLAFELCNRMRRLGWEAYFLHRSAVHTAPPANLRNCPVDLLLVIDYVGFASDKVAAWLEALPTSPSKRVRIILIEREGWPTADLAFRPPTWFEVMTSCMRSADLRQHLGKAHGFEPTISLADSKLTDDDLSAMLKSISSSDSELSSSPYSPKDITPMQQSTTVQTPITDEVARALIDKLKTTIDPNLQRPLFLLFLAQAFLADPHASDWSSWNLDDLHDIIYQRERQRVLSQVSEDLGDLALDCWAFATATGTPILNVLEDLPPWLSELLADQSALTIRNFRRQLRLACGDSIYEIVPFLPDVPGEYLVVTRLANHEDSSAVHEFSVSAWEHAPEKFAAFLARALADLKLSNPVVASVLCSTGLLLLPREANAARAFAQSLGALVNPLRPRTDVRDMLIELAKEHQTDEVISSLTIRAISVCLALDSETETTKSADTSLEASHPSNRVEPAPISTSELRPAVYSVLELWVGTLLSLQLSETEITEFETAHIPDLDETRLQPGLPGPNSTDDALHWLEDHLPDFRSVVRRCIHGVDATFAAVQENLPWLGQSEIVKILEAEGLAWNPLCADDETLVELMSDKLFERTAVENVSGQSIRESIDTLRDFSNQYPKNQHIAFRFSQCLANTMFHKNVQLQEKRILVNEFRSLAARFDTDEDIVYRFAKGLMFLYVRSGFDAPGSAKIVTELLALSHTHPKNRNIAEVLVECLRVQTKDGNLNFHKTREIVDEIRILTDRHRKCSEFVRSLAEGLFNLTFKDGTVLAEIDKINDELRSIADSEPNDEAITVLLAKSLCNTTLHPQISANGINRSLRQLHQLVEQHANNDEITQALARSVFALVFRDATPTEQTLKPIDELRALTLRYPHNNSMRAWLGVGLVWTACNTRNQTDYQNLVSEIDHCVGPLQNAPPDSVYLPNMILKDEVAIESIRQLRQACFDFLGKEASATWFLNNFLETLEHD